MSALSLVRQGLPSSWDGWAVKWERFEESIPVQICPPPKEHWRCECGSVKEPLTAHGWRQPKPGELTESTKRKMGRFGRWVYVPVKVAARWPVVDLFAFRCRDCGTDEVWDMRTNEWWTLGPEDYGPDGSTRPVGREWTGGLFDMLPDEKGGQ